MTPPGAMLGVLGGGQLARMFAFAAHRLGYRVTALDPSRDCAAAGAVDRLICAPLDDRAAWLEMARSCSAVTIETENVPAAALRFIGEHVPVAPDAFALEVSQHRLREKNFLSKSGVPVAPYADIASKKAASMQYPDLVPGILKTCRHGYDGKGQWRIGAAHELLPAFVSLGDVACVLEARLPLAAELSVILARDDRGRIALFPVPMNTHRDGVLDISVAPAPLPLAAIRAARKYAQRIAHALNYRGVLCVEFFLLQNGNLIVNEIAPRPHNSGHFTIEACQTSQFEQQVRVLAGMPLGSTRQTRPAAMVNLLGELWQHGDMHWPAVLQEPGTHLHLYGKSVPRPGRKMGHITCLGPSAPLAAERLVALRAELPAITRQDLPAKSPINRIPQDHFAPNVHL